jgi:hypothetical protein
MTIPRGATCADIRRGSRGLRAARPLEQRWTAMSLSQDSTA